MAVPLGGKEPGWIKVVETVDRSIQESDCRSFQSG